MSSSPPDIDRGPSLEAAIWTQVAIALVFVILRFWARSYRQAVALDDYLMLTSWVRMIWHRFSLLYLGFIVKD